MSIFQQMEKYMEKFFVPVYGDLSLTDEQVKYIETLSNAMFAYGVVWASAMASTLTGTSILQETEMFGMNEDTMSDVFMQGTFHEKEMVDWLKEQMALEAK